MGNITSIQRRNNGALIDDLILHYNGNQLQKGDDSAVTYSWYNLTDYTNYSTINATEYHYDANGNLKQDSDKNIVTIRYNVLNLPEIIQFRNGNQVINTYTANGQKLRTKYYTAISSVVNPVIVPVGTIHAPYSTSDAILRLDDYMGNILYENGTTEDASNHPLTKVMTPEGYVDYATPGKPYCYYRKDHLGSIREVDAYQGNNRTVVQKTQYYPSGTPFQESFGAGEQPYKFTDKEMITMHGLNWQDYGARWLDNARLQFPSVDPLAEKYYSISPYAYCAGNPVNNIDPFGLDVWTTSDPEVIQQFFAAIKSKSSSFEIKGDDWTHFSDKDVKGDKDIKGLLNTDTNHQGFYIQYFTSTGTINAQTFFTTMHLLRFPNIVAIGNPDSHFGLDGSYNSFTTNENKKAFKFYMNVALTLLLGPAVESLGLGSITASVGSKVANVALKAATKTPATATALKNLGGSAMIFLSQKTIQVVGANLIGGGIEGAIKYKTEAPLDTPYLLDNPAWHVGSDLINNILTIKNNK